MKKLIMTTMFFTLIASILVLRSLTPLKGVKLLLVKPILAATTLAQNLQGRILIQVESHGEAWYVNPSDQKRYFLGRPIDALVLMTKLGIGITDLNLKKIPVGLINNSGQDDDHDGLNNNLENSLGTDPKKEDSDSDGYNDKLEIENNYNPLGAGKLNIDKNFTKKNAGKIFLQIQSRGEVWYVNPSDQKRCFLGRPIDAWDVIKKLGLGITDENLAQIPIGSFSIVTSTPPSTPPEEEIFYLAAKAIMTGNTAQALSYFTPEMQTPASYTLNFLDVEGKFNLGNIMSGAKLISSNNNEKIYSTAVYFAGYTTILNFRVKKQSNGKWLLTNLN